MSEEKTLSGRIAVTASITTLAVPVAYIFGYAYDLGYLHAYGVSTEFFSRSIQEYLVFAFFACLGIATSTLDIFNQYYEFLIAIALGSGGITWLSIFGSKHRFAEWLSSKIVPLKEHSLFHYFFFPLLSACIAFLMPVLLIVAICVFLLIPGVAYFKGQNVAEAEIDKAKTCTYSNPPIADCVSLLENGKPVAFGKLVARSSTHIALFNPGKTSIYRINDQIVEVAPVPRNTGHVSR